MSCVTGSGRRHAEHRSRIRGKGYFSRMGPAIVTGAADDDPSGIGTYTQVGAAFGFGLLWLTPVVFPLATAVQELAARIGLSTGRGLSRSIAGRFPKAIAIGAALLVAAANAFNIGADLAAMTAAIRLLVPVPYLLVIVALTAGMLAAEIALPYRPYAHVLRWLTVSLGAYLVVLVVIDVDWGAVARATFIPSFPLGRAELAAVIAILGTTISPYLFFWQASEEVEEEQEQRMSAREALAPRHVRAMRGDVVAGMASAVLVMFAIMVASASTLHVDGVTQVRSAAEAASALEPVAGSAASLLFTLGIIGTGALAVPVLAGSTAYALAEAFGWREGLSRTFRQAKGFYLVVIGATVIGLAMDFVGIDPMRGLYLAAILNGIVAPPLLVLMLVLGNDERTVGRWRSGRWSNLLVGVALIAMISAPVAYVLS
jgi:NRAMP (natural resistance-associated macrophage protein)-like metal ion transporter